MAYMLLILGIFLFAHELNEQIQIKSIISIALLALDLLFIAQGRMAMLGTCGAILLAFLLTNKVSSQFSWKKVFLAVILLIIICTMAWDNIQGLLDLTKNEITGQTGNYIARVDELQFYTAQVDNSLFGRGYISPKTELGAQLDTKYGFYSIQDIGIYGLYVTNGWLGILWYASIFLMILLYTNKKKRRFVFYAYNFYTLIVCTTLLNYYYSSEYLVAILVLMATMEDDYCIVEEGGRIIENRIGDMVHI